MDEPGRLQRIFSLAKEAVVEVATHPAGIEDFQFLTGDNILEITRETPIASRFALPNQGSSKGR
jgi:hypothetical protein